MSRPSPSFRATWPPKRPTAPEAACWYCAMRSRNSSASSCCESGVEPTRSQKRTVSWRRSPGGTAVAGAGAPGAAATVRSGEPHPPQNLSPGWFATPHEAQTAASAAPHSAQKRRSARLSWSQDAQRIACLVACSDYHGGSEHRKCCVRAVRLYPAERTVGDHAAEPDAGAGIDSRGLHGSRPSTRTHPDGRERALGREGEAIHPSVEAKAATVLLGQRRL